MRTWDHIYADNSAKLKGVCRRYVKSDELAEDIMHDAFEIAMKKVGSFTGKGSFDGWLYQITVNTALQYLRKNKITVNKTDEVIDFHINKNIETELPQNQKSQVHQANFEVSDLLAAIDLLPEHHRTVFNLYVLEKYSHKEISKQLQITINTSKSHLNRARKKLQEILFEKAKEKNNTKKYLFLLFPFLFSIDGLYAKGFKYYTLSTNVNRIELSKINVPKVATISKLSKLIYLVVISSIIIGLAIYLQGENKQKYKLINVSESIDFNDSKIENYINEIDSLFNSIQKKELPVIHQTRIEKQPVVIKVPVVVHRKVIINDTIVK